MKTYFYHPLFSRNVNDFLYCNSLPALSFKSYVEFQERLKPFEPIANMIIVHKVQFGINLTNNKKLTL